MEHSFDPTGDIGRIDPIDGAQLAESWASSYAKDALFREVTSMPIDMSIRPPSQVRSLPRRRSAVVLAGAAAAAIVLFIAQGVWLSATPAYAVRPLPNGVIEINVTPQLRDGEALAAELRQYGIDVEIIPMIASPSNVGQVEIFRLGGGDGIPPGLTLGADGTSDVFNWQIDPDVFSERLTLEVHVAAEEGELYQVASEVFEPGEVLGGLHCALGEPVMAADVVPYLFKLGITAVWFEVTPTSDPSITNETEVSGVPNGEILFGYPRDANTVYFGVRPNGVTLSDYPSRLSDVACTPEQADVWR